jgi:large subunit ribosomal protein L29
MKATELREKTQAELNQRERELGEQLFKLRFQKVTGGGTLENPMKIRSVRREIARIKTLLQEKSKA